MVDESCGVGGIRMILAVYVRRESINDWILGKLSLLEIWACTKFFQKTTSIASQRACESQRRPRISIQNSNFLLLRRKYCCQFFRDCITNFASC